MNRTQSERFTNIVITLLCALLLALAFSACKGPVTVTIDDVELENSQQVNEPPPEPAEDE